MNMPSNIDRKAAYAMALDSDIDAERYQVVEKGELKTYWIGTVYGNRVSAEDGGHKCLTRYAALQQAKKFITLCATIVRDRANAPAVPITGAQGENGQRGSDRE